MRILTLTSLYPPHHAATYDHRCQMLVDLLRGRGHEIRVLTSNHGLNGEQRDAEIERRLRLQGVFGHPAAVGFKALHALEGHNHRVLNETVGEFQPELILVASLYGLSKSFVFALSRLQLPVAYAVADLWLAEEVSRDPWLHWWNAPNVPAAHRALRAFLEGTWQRRRLDGAAPTRLIAGLRRLPGVFDAAHAPTRSDANTSASFRFDRIFFISHALRLQTEQAGFRVGHGDIIHPGVATEQFFGEPSPPNEPTARFLAVCGLDRQAGLFTVLNALQRVPLSRGPGGTSWSLTVCGRGDSEHAAQLRSFALQHQLPVEFASASNLAKDLPALYRRHQVLLHPPELPEPWSETAVEAMASGLALVAARHGGITEILRHGDNSLLFNPGDPHDLAAQIEQVRAHPALRQRLAESGRAEVAASLNGAHYIDRVEQFLEITRETWKQF
jgi:glycosyltransferase involved in cell wall biosynthesis